MKSPAEIAANYVTVGETKCAMPAFKTLLLGVFAGMFIAFAGAASVFANIHSGKVAGAFMFTAGLAMVIIAGSELFTGNNLIIISVLQKKVSLLRMLRNWGLVYIGNFIGSLLIAVLAVYSGVFGGAETLLASAAAKSTLAFGDAFYRGILCNVLVCIAVWMSFSAEDATGKIVSVILPIAAFVVCGFEHSIANMFFIPAGLLSEIKLGISVEGLNLYGFLVNNLLPVTLGNIVGGCGIVGCGYWLAFLCKKK